MNEETIDNTTDRPVFLNNKTHPDPAVFAGAAPAPTYGTGDGTGTGAAPAPTYGTGAGTGAASTIVLDAHVPPSGKKHHTKPFYPTKMNNMAKKDTMDTTPTLDAPTTAPVDAFDQSPGLTFSNSPYSLRNQKFPTSSISTQKPLKKEKGDKVNF